MFCRKLLTVWGCYDVAKKFVEFQVTLLEALKIKFVLKQNLLEIGFDP